MANLIFDYTAPNTINQVTIDLSATPLQKGELYELTNSTIGVTQTNFVTLYVNGNNTATNYWTQLAQYNGILNQSDRRNFSGYGYTLSGTVDTMTAYIKITNSGHVVFITHSISSPNPTIQQNIITSTFTVSSITSLQIATQTGALGWGTGSRFQLRKVANKVNEIEVTNATTSVTLDNLTIGKENEYLLVSDIVCGSSDSAVYLTFNNNNTLTNYYEQESVQNDTSLTTSRNNNSRFSTANTNRKSLAMVNVKLSNNGYCLFQSKVGNQYDGSGTLRIEKYYGTSTFTTTSITSLRIQSSASNAIGVGSRIELYKLI